MAKMELLSLRSTSGLLLLYGSFSLLWVVTVNSTTAEPIGTSSVEPKEPVPGIVASVSVVNQNTSSLTLQWDKADDISTYKLHYDSVTKNINDTSRETFIQYVVPGLTAGTQYNFTVFTVANGVKSSGFSFPAATAPENVNNVSVVNQNTSSLTLQWHKVDGISTYKLQYEDNGASVIKDINNTDAVVQYVVSNLTAGTEYSFIIFTVLNGVSSSGFSFSAVKALENVASVSVVTQSVNSITLQWDKVDFTSTYRLEYEVNGVPFVKNINDLSGDTFIQHVVPGLTAGTQYRFIIFTVLNEVNSSGLSFSAATVPDNVASVSVETQSVNSITLKWNKVNGISTYRLDYEVNGSPVSQGISDFSGETFIQHVVPGLTAGTQYSFTLVTEANELSSSGFTFPAATAPENVVKVEVVTQSVNSITLQWDKVNDISTYKLQYEEDEASVIKDINNADAVVQYEVVDLTAGTQYRFIVFTVANGVNSSGLSFSAATVPENVENVSVVTQSVNSITLKWDKVNNISTYKLEYEVNGSPVMETINNADAVVQHVVSNLTAGTQYNFTIFTQANGLNSSGFIFTAATAPENVANVSVETQSTSSITLQWNKVDDISTYRLEYDSITENISDAAGETFVQYVVVGLTAGTQYSFTVFSEANGVKSSGFLFTAATAPVNVANVSVVTQSVNTITLQWDKVDGISTYRLQYEENGVPVIKDINDADAVVQYVVPGLTAGTKYSFTVFSEANGVKSSGFLFTAATVPPSVTSVRVSERLVDRVTLEWENPNEAWKHILSVNDTNASITQKTTRTNVVSYWISNLQPGTMYQFSVITEFSGLKSSAYTDHTLTQIDCSAVSWSVTNSSIQGTVEGLFSKASASNGSETLISPEGKDVKFSGLFPGATYQISLQYQTSSQLYPQCSIKIPIIPPSVAPVCSYWGSGYSALVKWDEPVGVWTAAELNINGKTLTFHPNDNELIVNGLQPAKTYKVSVISKLETEADPLRSEPFVFICSTDNRGVIGGSLAGVLLFALLICVVVFLFLKKPNIISRKKSFLPGSKKPESKGKLIPAAKFPDHYHQLSLDENRGFSQEYESLAPAGTNQTQKAATLPENKGKNRFTNILPYDWSRVKLNTSTPNDTLDYINANYLPGYSSSREYIACQGPLPNTLADFWRMVWEQKVKRIVMVTNCVEAGRTKCEQYWPEGPNPSTHGELIVSKTSEQRESNWVLREFKLKHTKDAEERMVKHFHFTAWPDHGVPQGTEVLIRFRGLVRKHIESEGSKAPTVVHCSAGVGRTGTIIALDVLLQQLQQERAVGINSFVSKMRQHRSHMVQTESQYVFLHQCIMDSLQPPGGQEENIYENDDLIYVNATALRQLR